MPGLDPGIHGSHGRLRSTAGDMDPWVKPEGDSKESKCQPRCTRHGCGAYAAALLVASWLAGPAAAADDQRATLEGYAAWANAALEAPPAGIQLLESLEQRLVELTSERRRKAGVALEPLQTDPDLLSAARAHARDMLERGYVDHATPEGHDPAERVALLHRRLVGRVGENLAEHEGLTAEQLEGQLGPLAVKIMDGLMQSPGHRENILSPDYMHLAIAAAAKGERVVLVQLFEARRALLAEPLPLRIGQGDRLPLEFEQGPGLSKPAKYAYAHPGQPPDQLVTLELSSNEVAVEPGAYLLQFLLPTEQADRFEVAHGPAIIVR
jgi:uncharacterized protein YkwD